MRGGFGDFLPGGIFFIKGKLIRVFGGKWGFYVIMG
jgi:hypothetical protein